MNQFILTGNLTADPEIRFTPSGAAVAAFTVAHTERRKDGDQWVDGDTLFIRCSVWRKQAEHFVESATKGDQVLVTGKLKQRSYETREGEKRTVMEVDVDTVALTVNRAPRPAGASTGSSRPSMYGSAAVSVAPGEAPF